MLLYLINYPLNELISRKVKALCIRKCSLFTIKINGRYIKLIAKECGIIISK